ncbi:MAG TPA: hypothetical protein VFV28_04410 [Limnobacter sp.]|nr:hypothetical protein [Limnobacter sp.]
MFNAGLADWQVVKKGRAVLGWSAFRNVFHEESPRLDRVVTDLQYSGKQDCPDTPALINMQDDHLPELAIRGLSEEISK